MQSLARGDDPDGMTDTASKLTARFLTEIENTVAKADGKGKDSVRLSLADVRMLLELAGRTLDEETE